MTQNGTVVEQFNGRLKDEFGGNHGRVHGAIQHNDRGCVYLVGRKNMKSGALAVKLMPYTITLAKIFSAFRQNLALICN